MSQTHDEIKQAFESYIAESEAFESKGVIAAAALASKALGLLGKATKVRRKEIQEKKNLCNHSNGCLILKVKQTFHIFYKYYPKETKENIWQQVKLNGSIPQKVLDL